MIGGSSQGGIPAALPLPASDSAFRLPPWPPVPASEPAPDASAAPAATVLARAPSLPDPAPAAPAPTSLAGMASRTDAILRELSHRDVTAHETLPLLRTVVDFS